jgi:tetratricopeptide (TPR) repeat protein
LFYFKKAETIYNKIGDRVSYAYTLWSIGTTYKLIGKIDRAGKSFDESARFFKETKDPRGQIYCILGIGEIDYLRGKKKKGMNAFMKSQRLADKYKFGVEKKYAGQLLRAVNSGKGIPANLP